MNIISSDIAETCIHATVQLNFLR